MSAQDHPDTSHEATAADTPQVTDANVQAQVVEDHDNTEREKAEEATRPHDVTARGDPGNDLEDEPTTILPASPSDMDDEPTTILAVANDMDDEPTTVLQSWPDVMEDEPTTVLPTAAEDFEEPTTILPFVPDEMDNALADEPTQLVTETPPDVIPPLPEAATVFLDITEIRVSLAEAASGTADPSDWFITRMQDFIDALRRDQSGAPRSDEDFQALTMTARDMLTRVAMQGSPRAGREGFTGDTVLQPDQVLANTYVVRSLIARGGVGEIYRTRHRDLKTEHAVKVLLPRFALDATMLTLMQDEARLLQCVRHDAVVGCQDLLRDADGRPMIVMDYLRGRTLSARLREGRLSSPELIVLARRLADGLAAIHAAGIVHQDISPDNVLLGEDSCSAATIIDFGLARRLGTGRDMHRNLDFAGKFSWSSPEQLSGRPAVVDARSDLYSLGLMLAAAARGFRLDMGNDLESARATRTTVPSLAGIEQPIAGLLEALLAPSPGARLASASEVGPMLEPTPRGFWRRMWEGLQIK